MEQCLYTTQVQVSRSVSLSGAVKQSSFHNPALGTLAVPSAQYTQGNDSETGGSPLQLCTLGESSLERMNQRTSDDLRFIIDPRETPGSERVLGTCVRPRAAEPDGEPAEGRALSAARGAGSEHKLIFFSKLALEVFLGARGCGLVERRERRKVATRTPSKWFRCVAVG